MRPGTLKSSDLSLSVIVPAYKAEKFIEKSLLNVKNVLDQLRYSYEIICVVDGKVDNLNISIDDEAKVLAKGLITKNTNVNIYGDGIAEVHTRKYFDAQVKGKGTIDYWGDPEEIRISASGGGSVNKKSD